MLIALLLLNGISVSKQPVKTQVLQEPVLPNLSSIIKYLLRSGKLIFIIMPVHQAKLYFSPEANNAQAIRAFLLAKATPAL